MKKIIGLLAFSFISQTAFAECPLPKNIKNVSDIENQNYKKCLQKEKLVDIYFTNKKEKDAAFNNSIMGALGTSLAGGTLFWVYEGNAAAVTNAKRAALDGLLEYRMKPEQARELIKAAEAKNEKSYSSLGMKTLGSVTTLGFAYTAWQWLKYMNNTLEMRRIDKALQIDDHNTIKQTLYSSEKKNSFIGK